jgi:hypothetical protein
MLVGGLLLMGYLAPPAAAQTRNRGPLVLELPVSTRGLGLGNSFALGSSDPDAVFSHPGLLGRVQGLSGSVQRYSSHSTLALLSAGRSWFSGGVGLGIQLLTYGASGSSPVQGSDILALSTDVGSLRNNGDVGVSELVVSAGYGRTVMGLRMGIVGKFVEQRFGSLRASTGAFDFGVSLDPGPLTLGLAVQNLGPHLNMGTEDICLPLRFNLGATTDRAPVGPLDLSATWAMVYRVEGELIPSVGAEVAYWPVTGRTFVGRLGYRKLPEEQSGWPVALGVGFYGDDIVLDYAYEGFDSGRGSHRISVGWR